MQLKLPRGLTATDKLAAGTPVECPITGGIQAIVNAVNVEQLALAIAQIETNFTAAKYDADNTNKDNIANALKDLNRLADVSADVDKDDIDASLVGGANGYIATITADILADTGSVWTTGTDAAKAAAIQL